MRQIFRNSNVPGILTSAQFWETTFTGTEADVPCFHKTTINTSTKALVASDVSGRGRLSQRNVASVVSWVQFLNGGVKMKRTIAAAVSLLAIITPAIAQPSEVVRMFDCSAFTHILWACLPPSAARDSANAMASAFMSEAIRLGRERQMSDGKLNADAMAALQHQRAKTGNTCSRLDELVRNYGKLCDALIGADKLLTKPTGVPTSDPG